MEGQHDIVPANAVYSAPVMGSLNTGNVKIKVHGLLLFLCENLK